MKLNRSSSLMLLAILVVAIAACSVPASAPTAAPDAAAATATPAVALQATATSEVMPSPAKATATASRMIFASPDKTPLIWAQLMVQNVKLSNTSYQHKDNGVTWAGVNGATDYASHADCSGFMNALIAQSYGLSTDDFLQWLGSRRPLARDYFAAVENKRGMLPITRIANVQPGDMITIRYLNSAPGDNTGHVLLAAAAPQRRAATAPIENNTQQWDVAIIDSSESGHGKDDTRRLADGSYHDGVGRGTMRLYTDSSGTIVGYTWSDLNDSQYYDAAARPLAIERLDPNFSLP